MAGNIFLKEFSSTPVTISSSAGSSTNGSLTSSGATLDMRSGGTSGAVEPIFGFCELTCQWVTITSITTGTIVADLYFNPAMDGSNYATVDTTGGAGAAPNTWRVGTFVNPLVLLVTATNYRFVTGIFDCAPILCQPYIANRSGQTISASWTLKFYPVEGQYT